MSPPQVTAMKSFLVLAAVAALSASVACGGSAGGEASSGADAGASLGSPTPGGASPANPIGDGPSSDDAGGGSQGSVDDAGASETSAPSGGDGGDRDAEPGPVNPLDPTLPPGGNFDLSIWQLQEPVGSPGAPTTFSPAQLKGPTGHQDKYFFTDSTDGSMTFWDPENGVTTANSNYPRSELREMTASGAAANWLPPGTHTLSATLKATLIPNHVAVGQIHLGTGTPSSTKPLLELFYFPSGKITIGIEQTPAGGNEVQTPVGQVPLGTKWSYVIGLSGNTISLVIDGGATQTFAMSPTFDQEGMYFKAGNYDQSVGNDAAVVAQVQFYSLKVMHAP